MRSPLRFLALALGCLLCAGGGVTRAGAQSAPAPIEAPAAAPATEPRPAAPADETRTLRAGAQQFSVIVRAARGAQQHGALVLLPPDGAHPGASAALERLRRDLPAHGWSSWLLVLEPPPRIHAGRLGTDAPAEAAPPAPDALAEAASPAPDAPAEAASPAPDAPAAEAPPAPDAERAAELQRWAADAGERIDAALTAARAAHPVTVLAAAGPGAALLARALPAASAALLIDPVEFAELAPAWPAPLPVPVMEILRPALAARRPPPAAPAGTGSAPYRRLVIDVASSEPFGVETLLTRRVRGWLATLAPVPAAAADAD